jgi:hypothetical protein
MFSGWGIQGHDGTAWYHPMRLTIDSVAVADGNANPAQRILEVDATHGDDLPKGLRIYAFGAALGAARVLATARVLARQSGHPAPQPHARQPRGDLRAQRPQQRGAEQEPVLEVPRAVPRAGRERLAGRRPVRPAVERRPRERFATKEGVGWTASAAPTVDCVSLRLTRSTFGATSSPGGPEPPCFSSCDSRGSRQSRRGRAEPDRSN